MQKHITITDTGCWNWIYVAPGQKYGYVKFQGKQLLAHRAAYLRFVGPIPNGLWVLHKCDNPRCINPKHLYLGTAKDNSRDRDVRGRANTPRGNANGHAKLTTKDVQYIRKRYRWYDSMFGSVSLAKRFRVSQATIFDIIHRKSWRHI